ncbi:Hsp70 family protein [Longispora albida]|uniref:Hsp70 family protein n=1 Tax=Longispora albida TaxID=203523 RepID=UPI0003A21AAA|nr:Hsp70 family protein [Longispora albida]
MAHRLGIDFGTSNTVAVMRRPDGQVRQLLFDGSPVLPSGVFTTPEGEILTGRDAAHSARLAPDRFVANPKRLLDEEGAGTDRAVTLIAAVLHRVSAEAERTMGGPPDEVVLTHPAAWDAERLRLLADAARRAGLPVPRLVPEPVAAACYFTTVLRGTLGADGALVVYDFGGGTFDASVVGPGPTVLSASGLPDVGGLDVDAALIEHLRAALPRTTEQWERLADPDSASDRRLAKQFLDDVRGAKEMLARTPQAFVYVPIVEAEAPIGREELDRLAAPLIDRTVVATREAITAAQAEPQKLAGVFLVGGSSRLPAVATLLHRAFGVAPTVLEQPELVVAEGSLVVPAEALSTVPAAESDTRELPVIKPAAPEVEFSSPMPIWAPVETPVPVAPAAVTQPVAYTLTTEMQLPLPRVLVFQLPSGPVHVITAGRPPSFLGSPRRVFAFRNPERLMTFMGNRSWPELVSGYPWADLPAPDAFGPPETVDLLGIGSVLAASCEPSSRPMHRDARGAWVPVPADSTSALPAGSLDAAILLLGALFASRGNNSQLLTPQRIANSSGPVADAITQAGWLSADVLRQHLGEQHRYRATSWWWQLLDALELLLERR